MDAAAAFPDRDIFIFLLLMARSVVEKGRGGFGGAVVDAAAVPAAAEVALESVFTAVAAAPVAAVAPPPWLADMTLCRWRGARFSAFSSGPLPLPIPNSYRLSSRSRTQTHSLTKLVWSWTGLARSLACFV